MVSIGSIYNLTMWGTIGRVDFNLENGFYPLFGISEYNNKGLEIEKGA